MSSIDPPPAVVTQAQQLSQDSAAEVARNAPGDLSQIDMSQTFSTYDAFARKYPELHKNMLKTIANDIIGELRRHEARWKEIEKQSRQS